VPWQEVELIWELGVWGRAAQGQAELDTWEWREREGTFDVGTFFSSLLNFFYCGKFQTCTLPSLNNY
jgi:hypothetical protein